MYHKHHTKGIVLGNATDGEGSTRAKVLTEDFGLISVKFQGAKDGRSKFRPASQAFSFGTFSLIRGKSGWRAAGALLEKNFFEILKDRRQDLTIAANIFSLIRKILGEEEKSPVFEITLAFLNFLENCSQDSNTAALECLTAARILHVSGYLSSDPSLLLPLSSWEVSAGGLESLAPKRSAVIKLINQSLKSIQI